MAFVRKRGIKLNVMGMDGCSVIHSGFFRKVEEMQGYSVV
jgi:hypothetical protein